MFVRPNVWRSLWQQRGPVRGRSRVAELCRGRRGRRGAGHTATDDGRRRAQHFPVVGRRRVRVTRLVAPTQPGRHVAQLVSARFTAGVQQQRRGKRARRQREPTPHSVTDRRLFLIRGFYELGRHCVDTSARACVCVCVRE